MAWQLLLSRKLVALRVQLVLTNCFCWFDSLW